jgi:hypothetical protein
MTESSLHPPKWARAVDTRTEAKTGKQRHRTVIPIGATPAPIPHRRRMIPDLRRTLRGQANVMLHRNTPRRPGIRFTASSVSGGMAVGGTRSGDVGRVGTS